MTIRVMLADDHPIIRRGVKHFLSNAQDIELVGEAVTGDEAIEMVNRLNPDILLLDIQMPGKDGIEVMKELKASESPVKIIGFSAFDDHQLIRGFLNMGAAGFLTKDEAPETLLEAIHGVAGGQQGFLSRRIKAIVMKIYRGDDEYWDNKVSPREAEVCRLVAQGKTNKQIAYAMNISEKTVEKYVYNVFQKLEVVSRVELAVMISRQQQIGES